MTRDCTFIGYQLSAYAADALTPSERSHIEAHLAGCEACQDELAREFELREILGGLPEVPCPETVLKTLAGPSRRQPELLRWPTGLGLVAALLLFILLVPGLLTRYTTTTELAARSASGEVAYSARDIAQARHDILVTLSLAATILDRSSDRTMLEVFGRQIPEAINSSLRNLDSTSQDKSRKPNPTPAGGKG